MNALKNSEHRSNCARCGEERCRTRPGIEAPERFLALPNPAAASARLRMAALLPQEGFQP